MRDFNSDSGGYEEFYLLGYNAVTFNGLHGVISQNTEFLKIYNFIKIPLWRYKHCTMY
jgi:hypothetical protein